MQGIYMTTCIHNYNSKWKTIEIHLKTPLAEKHRDTFWVFVETHEQASAKMKQIQTRDVLGFYAFGSFTKDLNSKQKTNSKILFC